MNVKNNHFVAFTQTLVFSNKHKICSGGVGMTEVNNAQLPRRLTAKQKFSKWMTGNRNANKKEEINEGEMQIASVSRKKITNKLIYIETNDWYTLPQPL